MMRVLVVEDSPAQAETLRLMLEAEGVEVESVPDAEKGLDALRGAPFDLVISDVMMPDTSGYDLCRSIKGDPALQATPVILLTALSGLVDMMEGLACGDYAQTLFRKLIDEGSATVHDLHLLRRDADPVVVDVSASRVKTQGRHVVLAIARDVTERNLLQQRMLQSEKLATVGVLSAGLAHEINTPTAVVLANLGALEGHVKRLRAALAEVGAIAAEAPPELRRRLEGVANEGLSAAATAEFNEILHDCRHAGECIRDIVRDLKSFSHIDEGEVALVDLHERLDTSVRMAANEVRYRARVEKHYERDLPPVVASPGKLNQLFLNLIVNAAQAIEVGRAAHNKIVISTRVEGDRLRVDIADTGAGIAPDALSKLFEPFFTTKAVGVGTGLGLFICHDIVKKHGGELRVESKPGAGTTFTVFLPRHTGFQVRCRAAPAPVEPVRRARVLVVDDEAFLLRAYQRTLGGHHEVTTALGGRAALEALCFPDASFDVIFCDLMMPDVDGVDVYRYVAEKRPELVPRLVFITGGAYTTRVQDFLASVDNPRLEKPFSTEELQHAIAGSCARGSLDPRAQ